MAALASVGEGLAREVEAIHLDPGPSLQAIQQGAGAAAGVQHPQWLAPGTEILREAERRLAAGHEPPVPIFELAHPVIFLRVHARYFGPATEVLSSIISRRKGRLTNH